MTETQRIQCALADLGLPNEYWAYSILLTLCNDVMHARIKQFSADNPIGGVCPPEIPIGRRFVTSRGRVMQWNGKEWVEESLHYRVQEIQTFLSNLTADDIAHEKRCRMIETISELLKF